MAANERIHTSFSRSSKLVKMLGPILKWMFISQIDTVLSSHPKLLDEPGSFLRGSY